MSLGRNVPQGAPHLPIARSRGGSNVQEARRGGPEQPDHGRAALLRPLKAVEVVTRDLGADRGEKLMEQHL